MGYFEINSSAVIPSTYFLKTYLSYMIVSYMFICTHICSYVHILHLYGRCDYVLRCENAVSVELRYIN